jgi:hypothetical protein
MRAELVCSQTRNPHVWVWVEQPFDDLITSSREVIVRMLPTFPVHLHLEQAGQAVNRA